MFLFVTNQNIYVHIQAIVVITYFDIWIYCRYIIFNSKHCKAHCTLSTVGLLLYCFSSLETRTWLDLCHKKSLLPFATLFYALGVVKSAFCLVFSLCMHVTMIRLALKCDLFHRNKATIPRISIIQLFQY